MQVERLKYTIWAADADRAAGFYQTAFGAQLLRKSPHITELYIGPSTDSTGSEQGGGVIAIHGGGEGKQTWTGLSFQVADVVAGAQEVIAAGGKCERDPQPENGEPPHLAMCEDTDGNQIMLTRKR
ncbi:MAG: VOC family protein [Coraliomargarita sp.]